MEKLILVQEQGGNITYNISGFKRIEIQDDAADLHLVNPGAAGLFSIRVFFGFWGKGERNVVLGRYMDYKDAYAYYTTLLAKLADGELFISMVPTQDREIPDRSE